MKVILLISVLTGLCSCYNEKEIEARIRHQAETGSRINASQKNTDSLFKEID